EYHYLEHVGVEFATVQDQHDARRHHHEDPGIDEPGQRRHAEVIGAQAEDELVGRHRHDPCPTLGEGLALLVADIGLTHRRRGSHQHGREVVLAHAPAEGEEGIDEHHGEAEQLYL